MPSTFEVTPMIRPYEKWNINPLNVVLVRPVLIREDDQEDRTGTQLLFVNTIGAESSVTALETPKKVRELIDAALRQI